MEGVHHTVIGADQDDLLAVRPLGRERRVGRRRRPGTEAAAVTSTGISVTSVHTTPVVRVDRPFVFVIRERLSGTVLFMGKIVRMPN